MPVNTTSSQGRFSKNLVIMLGVLLVLLLSAVDMIAPPAGIPLAIVAIWWLTRHSGSWASLGLGRPDSWAKTILAGVALGIGLQLFLTYGIQPLLEILLGKPDANIFASHKGDLGTLLMFLFVSWTTAGMGEEIIWRGFLLPRFALLFGGGRKAWVLSFLVVALAFGLLHIRMGPMGVILTGLTGLIFGIFFITSRRNLWLLFFAHATMDTVGFVMLYFGLGY